jgi:hypothetical protein
MSLLNSVVRGIGKPNIEIATAPLSRFFAEEGFSGTAETIAVNTRRLWADLIIGSPWHGASARLSGSSQSPQCSTSSGAVLMRSVTCCATRGAARRCSGCLD